ncbi:uncharacterized protein LOC127479915 [Manacus candei]|uniref:uncharacterized protein LOC127479915 n=1 Tax=Manacus candei TaxID=415023 RepID=UPI00222600CE|nr:uncharacterized protein LOC127479915 [Manacus candei]
MLFLTPPGQAEVSASGAILPEALAPSFPSVAVGVPDASGRTNPVAFTSNVLCCVPAVSCTRQSCLSSWERTGRALAIWPLERLSDLFQQGKTFWLPLSLRSPWVCRTPLAGLTLWLLCPTCCAACLQGKTFWLPLSLRSPWVCRTPLAGLTLWLLCPTCCAACLQGKTFWLPLSLRSPWVCRTPLAGLTLWLLCPTCCAACLQGKTFWLPLFLRSPWVCRTPLAGLTLWLLCPTCCAVCACRGRLSAPLGEPQCLAGAERACREVFTWSASGAILPEALAPSFPSVAVGVPDASGRTNPVAFMSNVLCCVPAGEDFLAPSFPSVAVGVPDASGRTNPVAFMSNVLCCVCLQNCQERKYFRGASLQISPEYARRFQPGGKELWKKSSLKGASGDHQVFQPRRTRREMGEWGSNS